MTRRILFLCTGNYYRSRFAEVVFGGLTGFADVRLLQEKGIRCQLDLWGYDVSHDWEWWQRQLAHHLPRFC